MAPKRKRETEDSSSVAACPRPMNMEVVILRDRKDTLVHGGAVKTRPADEGKVMLNNADHATALTPRRSARRGVKSEAPTGAPFSSGDEADSVVSPRRRRKLPSAVPDSDVDSDDLPISALTPKRLHRRRSDSHADSDDLPITPKRVHRHKSESNADSDDLPITPKRVHRRRSDSDAEYDDLPITPKHVYRRKSDSDADADADGTEGAAEDHVSTTDSADKNDLESSPPPSRIPSKPTEKELKLSAHQELITTRKNKSSPASAQKTRAKRLPDYDDDSFVADSRSHNSEMDTQTEPEKSEYEKDFIDDAELDADSTPDPEEEVNAARGPEYYANREPADHFAAYMEYLARLVLNPELLSTDIPDTDRWSYEAADKAMRQRTEAVAEAMQLSTWSAPFKITLDSRPILVGPVLCEKRPCQACWTRGNKACNFEGSYTLSTRRGFYDAETFEDQPEKDMEYEKDTTEDFENSAQADQLLYPPGFRLVVGARCVQRAAAYHQAQHYLYSMFTRVKGEIQTLGERHKTLMENEDDVVDAIMDEFATELWKDFCLDSKQWLDNFVASGLR
ncbi:hypothetical protein DFH06DRAFT_10010 [Mycena polygramma]|nr:hypothetical protein DFH06DRAFT_10010 [Mycena polygramma]